MAWGKSLPVSSTLHPSNMAAEFVEIETEDSEDDLPREWEVRATDDGKLFYAK